MKPVTSCVAPIIDVSEKQSHYVVGTDGKHLFIQFIPCPIAESVIIPDHRFLAWKGFGQDGDWLLRIESDKNGQPAYIELTSFGWTFVAKAIDGNYPNWRQVLPDPSGLKTTIKIPQMRSMSSPKSSASSRATRINHPVGLQARPKRKTRSLWPRSRDRQADGSCR